MTLVNTDGIDDTIEKCGGRTIFWPDDECCDAICIKPKGHACLHEDEDLGEWIED